MVAILEIYQMGPHLISLSISRANSVQNLELLRQSEPLSVIFIEICLFWRPFSKMAAILEVYQIDPHLISFSMLRANSLQN